MRAVDDMSVGPSPCVRARFPVAAVRVLTTCECRVASERKTISARLGLDDSSHEQRLSWRSLEESLDGVRLGGGDCGGTDQGGVEDVWWNFLAVFALASYPVVPFRAITSSAPLVPTVAELGAKVELPLHIPERTNKVICYVKTKKTCGM